MFPDTSNLSPVLSPILAGRADEVGLLRHRLGQARDSTGTTVLLSGEAGIGKSRLAHEAKTMAAELGFDVLQGNCYEQDRGLPFAPFVDLLRKNLTGLQDQSGLPQLLKLAPDLAPQFPDVQLAPVAEPEQEKRNLFPYNMKHVLPRLERSVR